MSNIEKKGNNTNAITISRTYYNDLTHLITQDMPVYPGDPQPEFKPIATIENEKVNVTCIVVGSHTGTHVDAQKHFIANGSSIDKGPLNKFIGEAITLNLSNINIGDGIGGSDLENYSKVIKKRTFSFFTQVHPKQKMIRLEPILRIWNHLLRIGS